MVPVLRRPVLLALLSAVVSRTEGLQLIKAPPCAAHHRDPMSSAVRMAKEVRQPDESTSNAASASSVDEKQVVASRRAALLKITPVAALLWGAALASTTAARADEESLESPPPSIAPCARSGGDGSSSNCVSTASVRQLDQYQPPWTYNGMSRPEVAARLKGVIESDPNLNLVEEQPNYWKVQAVRNFNTDEIELAFNDADQVITFRSSQVTGPNVSDFGANRSRLEEIRSKAQLGVMGQEYNLADPTSEGALGQLKAFYGFQSGTGFEDINLDR